MIDKAFQAENTLFLVPFKLLQGAGSFVNLAPSLQENEVIICDPATAFEVETLLFVLDAPAFGGGLDDLNIDQWTAVLKLSTHWGFAAVRDYAIAVFDTRFEDQDPSSRIELAEMFEVFKWIKPAYHQLSKRPTVLSLEEAERLGMAHYSAITQMREETHQRLLERPTTDDLPSRGLVRKRGHNEGARVMTEEVLRAKHRGLNERRQEMVSYPRSTILGALFLVGLSYLTGISVLNASRQ
ncbi:hypothetical protein FRB96_008894 [Tulasnella sp. 330]|nr:hypothetical protein FRB96_008894 [Tulasnella sp. 330]